MNQSGFDKQRFPSLPFDSFDCIICSEVVIDPMECKGCGKLFCKRCINDWASKNPAVKCPNRCKEVIVPIFSKALQKLYQNLDIRCSNPECKKIVKISDLTTHEENCRKIKCWNFEICEKNQNQIVKGSKPCCSATCQVLFRLSTNFGNKKKMYEILGEFIKEANHVHHSVSLPIMKNLNRTSICWDTTRCGTGIQFSDNDTHVFLKEQSYVFRTVIANIGFESGINYWEIIADPKTQNELKIGVSGSKQLDLNSAFCDHPFGYAYYGLGQLRQGSNASGPSYGKRFKKEGILGVCLNMKTGTLSFALDGFYFGVAFRDTKLTSGIYYPAVSLLHCAGCKIRSGIPVPSYFVD